MRAPGSREKEASFGMENLPGLDTESSSSAFAAVNAPNPDVLEGLDLAGSDSSPPQVGRLRPECVV